MCAFAKHKSGRIRPQDERGREHHTRGLKTSDNPDSLRDSDLAGLDVLGFGQSQCHEALVDFRVDFVRVDRWIELEHAPKIFRTRFAMNQRSFHCWKRTPSDDC